MQHPPFTAEDAACAYQEWGCNCGPAALAAVLGLTLDTVRLHMGDFESKGYTNPTLMRSSLQSLHRAGLCSMFLVRPGHTGRNCWPTYGLARIQWEGPWMKPGVPPAAAYRHTHWIGVNARSPDRVGIFDVNALGNGSGWCSLEDWSQALVPWILRECVPRADGGWHITHVIQVAKP